jgi:hypothetical protein
LGFLKEVESIKDNDCKDPLLLHLVELTLKKFPDSTNLHAELDHVHKVGRVGLLRV